MRCWKCGSENSESGGFCRFCGAPLRADRRHHGLGRAIGLLFAAAFIIGVALAVKNSGAGVDNGGTPPAHSMEVETERPSESPETACELISCTDAESFYSSAGALIAEYGFGSGEDVFSSARLIVKAGPDFEPDGSGALKALQGPDDIWVLQFDSPQTAETALEELSAREEVAYAEPDAPAEAAAQSGSDGPVGWGISAVGADTFARSLSGQEYSDVTVAVVDSGVSDHPLLDGRLMDGWDFVDNDAEPADERNHGTHVAGIIADATPGLEKIGILPVRVLNADGKGSQLVVGLGIRYAADMGATVINLSLSGGHTQYLDESVAYAMAKGAAVVAAAGNDSDDTANSCPAHIDDCIVVSAVDESLSAAYFSNYGMEVDFCAPGVYILSSVPGGYMYMSGTSMATPHISALVAMLQASGLAETATGAEMLLISCAGDLGAEGWDAVYGHGLPDISGLAATLEPDGPFDGTYWDIYLGQSLGTFYQAQFYSDGSLKAVSRGGLFTVSGSYTYENEVLSLSLDRSEPIEFVPNGDGSFRSAEPQQMQVGKDYCSMHPADGVFFNEYYVPED